jgi:predicted dehydrogenase
MSEKLKLLFFGFGSIGKKHIKIIKNNFNHEIFAYRTNLGQEINDIKVKEINNKKEAFDLKPDIAFITNPTFLHIKTCLECVKHNIALFIEKPISHSLEYVDILNKEITNKKLFTYVGFNLRFHPVVSYLKKFVEQKENPIYFNVICSSYLPCWRPAQDYTKSYSIKEKSGGGIVLELSHEFDYINWLFDGIIKIKGFYGTISNLKVECEDIFEGQIICNKSFGNLHLDFFSRKIERKIQIYYNNEYIEGDLIKNEITKIDENDKKITIFFKNRNEDMYKKQLEFFFNEFKKNNIKCMNNYSEALTTFKKIAKFKEQKNRWKEYNYENIDNNMC